MMVGRLLSYWEDNFSGAMLNFGRVSYVCYSFFNLHSGNNDHIAGWKMDWTD